MYQIDNATAVAAQPPSSAAGNAGYFTDGSIAAAQPPTIFPAEFANMLMLEILNAVKAAGITPDKTKFNQLALAIGGGRTNYGHDSGVANAYALALGQAPAALLDGMVVCFLAANANTGASTLNLNGIGAQPILGTAHAALKGGEIVANGFVRVQWNVALASWVILDNTGGIQQGATAAQFDNSVKLASTAFVKAAGQQFSSVTPIAVNTTLNAAHVGGLVVVNQNTAAINISLPATANQPGGSQIVILNQSGYTVTVAPGAGDGIAAGGATRSYIIMQPYDSAVFASLSGVAGSNWELVSGSSLNMYSGPLSASTATNGYQKLPSGIIYQWGQASANNTSDVTVTFPIAYPAACLTLGVSTGYTTGSGTIAYACGGSQTKTNFVVRGQTAGLGITWWSVGY